MCLKFLLFLKQGMHIDGSSSWEQFQTALTSPTGCSLCLLDTYFFLKAGFICLILAIEEHPRWYKYFVGVLCIKLWNTPFLDWSHTHSLENMSCHVTLIHRYAFGVLLLQLNVLPNSATKWQFPHYSPSLKPFLPSPHCLVPKTWHLLSDLRVL